MKIIDINKKLNNEKGNIELKYNGIITKENVDLEKIETLIEDFINNHRHNNMIENVTIIRTILKDCEEQSLFILYQDETIKEQIAYNNSLLSFYEKSNLKEFDSQCDRYKIKYETSTGIKFEYNNQECDLEKNSSLESISKEITEIIKQIYNLNNTKTITLTKDDKLIIEIYKLFYNENPNFISKDINIKVQTMMSILAKYGISLGNYYGFSILGKSKMPLSLTLQKRVNKLYPLGEVKNIEEDIKLADESKKIIKIVGECIREEIVNKPSPTKALIRISKIIYDGEYELSNAIDVNKLSEIIPNNYDEIKTSIKILKKINKQIAKQ